MSNLAWLKHRRTLLENAIAYVATQAGEPSSDTANFLHWAKAELRSLDTKLQGHEDLKRACPGPARVVDGN